MRKITLSLLLSCILTSQSEALHIIPIKDHEISQVEISNSEHTRISVENDRIAQLFGIDGRLSFEVDELNGQVFITPSPDLKGSSILITVTTEKGLTHDLRIQPIQKVADAILLRPKTQHIQGKVTPEFQTYERELVEFVRSYSHGKDQDGYQFIKLEDEIVDKISPEVGLTISIELHSSHFVGKICKVKNSGSHPLMISPHHFAKYQPLAVAFHKRDLKSSEHTEVLLIVRKVSS